MLFGQHPTLSSWQNDIIFHYVTFITVADIRHRHPTTDDIHQINKRIKPFVADKKSASVQFDSREDANDLWLEETGLFFFFSRSPWDETFCANHVSWYEHNADVGVCHEDAHNSPCPWPPSQEGSKHSEVTPWAVSCQTSHPHYHWWGWRGPELRWRSTPQSFVSGCVTHTLETRHTPCINQSPRFVPVRRTSSQHDDDTICRFPYMHSHCPQLQIADSLVFHYTVSSAQRQMWKQVAMSQECNSAELTNSPLV